MKLTIAAATGRIGRHILDQALAAGHDVTALVRDPSTLPGTVRAVTADLAAADPAALRSAIDGADAVLSGLGPRSRADTGVAAPGTTAILAAMATCGVRRILVVSASPVGTVPSPARPNPPKHDPGDGFVMRHLGAPFARAMFGGNYADLARMEDALRASDTDWTAVRPPRLTDKPATGRYRTELGRNVRGGVTIARADVAAYLLRAVDRPETFRQTVGIAN
ncbi:MAG TPA: NAD(P)H-binding protein [Pseudonocardiaceae bacterium]|jgi:putative NADH-flavin reductase|nr:NAD(P)H-binding protein [Pseudonocardiaceae bacterium]